jgi:hypothetical protein
MALYKPKQSTSKAGKTYSFSKAKVSVPKMPKGKALKVSKPKVAKGGKVKV